MDWLDQHSEEIDLRKKRDESATDRIVRRADWLDSSDRELVLAMFRDGRTANSIADLTEQCPRQIRKQIRRLVHRLNDPCVAYVIAHHEQWSKSRCAIARSIFIQGRSMREATDELGVSLYSVRKHRQAIEAMCQAAQASMKNTQIRAWRTTK